jgi:predicted aspartyl protease
MPIIRAVALLSLALPTAGAAPPTEEIILSLRTSGTLRVPVSVNGAGPFSFLLDTGSSHTIVSSELVDRLGLPVVAQARVVTPAGVEMGRVVTVERLSIGSADVSGLMPSVVSLAELRASEPGLDGVLGQDFLKQFDYTVDYRRERLRFTAGPDDEHVHLPLVRAGDRSLVQLPGPAGDEPVLMVPDSGSGGFVIFEREGRTAVRLDSTGQGFGVSGLASRQTGRGALLRELKVGGVTFRNQPAVVLERRGARTVEGDGLLPLHPFSSVSFSNSEGFMVVRR